MGLRQDKRGLRVGGTGPVRKDEHCASDQAQKHGLFVANHCACRRTRRSRNVVLVPALQQFPFVMQPNRLLVVQTGDSMEQAKVFTSHAVLQGLCALKFAGESDQHALDKQCQLVPKSTWNTLQHCWSNIEDPCPIVVGRAILKKFYWDSDGTKYRIGSAYSCIESKVYSCR